MKKIDIDYKKLIFTHLPLYSKWLLENKLPEFVANIIKLSRQENLPLLKSLGDFSDEQLTDLSLNSYRAIFAALSENNIASHIEANIDKWLNNALKIIDQNQIEAEDLTLAALIKRKTYYLFLDEYTTDPDLIRHLISEIDTYTSWEELFGYKAFISMQSQKIKKANDNLKFQESLLLAAEELGETGSFLVDFKDRSKSIYSPQYEKIFEVKFRSDPEKFIEFVHPEDRESYQASLKKAFSEGGEYEVNYRYLIKGKEKRIWSKGVCEVENGKTIKIKGTIRDITKNHHLINKLQESDKLNKQAQELTNLGSWTWDVVNNTIDWSDQMYRIYEVEPGTTITFEKFVSLIHEDDREKRVNDVMESLKTHISPSYTLRIITPGKKEKILRGRGRVETNYKHEAVKLHGTCQDITKEFLMNKQLISLNDTLSHKNTELEQINKELASFNYIASHDMQEPLRKIQTYTSRLIEEDGLNLSDKSKEYLDKTISSATRMQRLINDLISFSQLNSTDNLFETVDLNVIIEDVRNNLSEMFTDRNARLEVEDLPKIKGVPFQLNQLFTNIIGNAIKYRKTGVDPYIKITSNIIRNTDLKLSADTYLQITVSDNGIGFEEDQKEKIFDLFTRLHPQNKYSGTGIGLSICKKIVQYHAGFIEADSKLGEGSEFKITLPY